MTFKLLAIAATSLSLGTMGALAQTDTTPGTGAVDGMPHEGMPMEWEGSIGDAFYSDPELGTLHGEDEMRANWDGLSEEDQTAVREYCERYSMDEGGVGMGADTGTGAATDTGAPTAADTGTAGEATDSTAMAPAEPGADMHQASLRQICEVIEDDSNI